MNTALAPSRPRMAPEAPTLKPSPSMAEAIEPARPLKAKSTRKRRAPKSRSTKEPKPTSAMPLKKMCCRLPCKKMEAKRRSYSPWATSPGPLAPMRTRAGTKSLPPQRCCNTKTMQHRPASAQVAKGRRVRRALANALSCSLPSTFGLTAVCSRARISSRS